MICSAVYRFRAMPTPSSQPGSSHRIWTGFGGAGHPSRSLTKRHPAGRRGVQPEFAGPTGVSIGYQPGGAAVSNDSITLALDGEVQIEDFASAMDGFRRLIAALTRDVGRQSVEWIITNLDAGSATVTARGESTSLETVEHIAKPT